MILQHAPSVFEIDLFTPALSRSWKQLITAERPLRTSDRPAEKRTADTVQAHDCGSYALGALTLGLKVSCLLHDGRGSVLRRLIRRAATRGRSARYLRAISLASCWCRSPMTHGGLHSPRRAAAKFSDVAGEMVRVEEQSFAGTLKAGLQVLDRIVADARGAMVPGERLFQLHAERGFPVDLAAEVLAERGIQIEWSRLSAADLRASEVSRAQELGEGREPAVKSWIDEESSPAVIYA